MEKSSNDKIQMSNQIQNPNVKIFSKTFSYLSFSHVASQQVYAFLLLPPFAKGDRGGFFNTALGY